MLSIAGIPIARPSGSAPLARDTFSRADSALTLGSAESGQAWTALSATWGVSTQQAYTTTSVSNAVAVVDAGVANGRVRVTTTVPTTDAGVIARATDNLNYIRFIFEAGVWYLQKMVAGALTTIASAAGTSNAGDVVQLECRGTSLVGTVNGAVLASGTDVFNQTVTKHGMTIALSSGRLDNFAFYP